MDGSCNISKEEGLSQNASLGLENEHELNSPEADKDNVMDNNKRLIRDAGADDSEEVKDTEAGYARTEQRVYKNGVIMCSFENVDRKCGLAENMTSTERDDEVTPAPGHLSPAEMAVGESAGDLNKPRCLNEDVISNNQDGLWLGDIMDNTPHVESSKIEGQNSNILGTNLIGMNDGKNDSSFLVPSSTDENICAEVNVLKMTCSNVCPLKKESLKWESGQQCGIEDSCINVSPPLVSFTSTVEAKNSSGNSCNISESTCNNSDYLVDKEATLSDGDYLIDKETLKQAKNPKNNVEASCNDNVHPVDTEPTCNDNVHPVDTEPTCNDIVHPVDTEPTCNDNVHPVDTDATCNDNVHPVDTEPTCNDNVHPVDTEPTCNDIVHPVDTEPTCNDNVHPVDTDATCNDNVHPVDTEPTCNDNVHPVDTEPTCNDNVHPVDTDATCNDNVHPVDTEPTCNDNVHPVDTDATCNDNVHPVDTEPTCNDNVHPVDTGATCNDNFYPVDTEPTCNDNVLPVDTEPTCNDNVHLMEALKQEIDGKGGMGDNCINESLPLVPLTTNDNAKDSACAEVQVSEATSNDHDYDVGKESSKQDSDEQNGLQINIDESLSLDFSATNENIGNVCLQINAKIDDNPSLDLSTSNEKTRNFSLQINAEIDDSPSLDLSTSTETTKNVSGYESDVSEVTFDNTKNVSGYESDVSEVTFDNNVCEAVTENSSQEMDQENGVKTITCISSSLAHLDKDEHVQTLASDEKDILKATFNDSVSFVEDETSRLANDQQNDRCMSSSPVPLDTDTISETLKWDESSISKDTICDKGLPVHEESLQIQDMLNRGIHKTNSDLQSSIFVRCEHSTSLDKDVHFKKQHGVETSQKVVIDLVQENCSADIEVDMSESLVTVDRTACSESLAGDLSETLMTVNKTARRGSVEVAITESQVRSSKTVQSTTVEVDVPELLKTVNKMAHSDSLGEDILESSITTSKTVRSTTTEVDVPKLLKTVNKMAHLDSLGEDILKSSITTSKTVQSTTTEVDVPELLKTVSKTVHSEGVGEDIPELLRAISKTAPFGSIGEDVDGTVQIVDMTADSDSLEENLSDSHKTFDQTARGEDVEGDICRSLKKSNRKAMSKKKKRMKEKKGHRKKSKRKQESEQGAENLRLVEVSRDVNSAEGVGMEEVEAEGRSVIYNRLCDERMSVNPYEELLNQEVENQEMAGLREPGEIELIKERKKKGKKKKKKKRRRRVATVEEGDVGDNAWHQFPTYLDGFFLQYDEGNEELDETVGDASVSSDIHARMFNTEERIYPRHFSFESEDSVKSGNCSDSAQNRFEELERRRRKRHDKREHKERKRKKERSNSHEARHEREHFVTLSARSNSHEAQHEREHFMTLSARRQHMFDRERIRSARDEEQVRSSDRKIRRIDRERDREKVMPDKDRRRVEVDVERRRSARSSSQDYRTVIAERSPAHSGQHRQRSESRGAANDMEQERGRGRAKPHDKNDTGRKSHKRDRNAENSRVESSQHRSERGSDKENNRRHKRRRQMRTHETNDSDSRDRIRNARRVHGRGASVSSSSSVSNQGVVRHRGDDSDDDHCIIISQENSDDDGASSDVILVESERIVINLDDDEDAPPSRVNITRGGRNPPANRRKANRKSVRPPSEVPASLSHSVQISEGPERLETVRDMSARQVLRKANRKSVRPPSELSASLSHSVQISDGPKSLETVRDMSARQVLRAAPASDRCSIEVETLSVVTSSSSAYDPLHPTEEAEECNFTHPAFSSSRIPTSPLVERRPVSPDSPAPKEGRPSTPPLPIVMKAGTTTASPLPSQPSVGDVSSNPTSVPAFLTHTQSQQQSLMPLPSHLGCELEQASNFPSRSLRSSLSPNKQRPNGGLTPGFPAVQQSRFPTQDTVQLLPLQNSTRLPLPFNSVIPPFLPPPPPPPFGVCLEAAQRLPVPTLNQFFQLASSQPSLEASQHLQVPTLNQFSQLTSSQPSLEASHLVPVSPVNQFSQPVSTRSNVEASQYLPVSPMNGFTQLASTQPSLEASQYLPVSPMNGFTQIACTQPVMERHNIDSYTDNQDMLQPFDIFSSLQTKVCIQPTLTDKSSPPVGSLAADLSSSCSHSSQGHDCGDIVETTKATDMDFSSEDDDYHLELLSPKANRKDSKRGRQQRQHSNLNQGASSGNSCNPGSSSELSVKHGKTVRKDANKVAPKEHLQVSQDRPKVHRGKKKRVENKVRDEENDDDVPASAADLTCKEKFLKKLFFQERVIEEVKMAVKPFYNSKKITKEQYKVILRKAVPKVCHNKKGNINPQKILHLVEAYVRKMKGQGSSGGKKGPQVQQHRGVEKHNPKDKNVSASVKHNGDRTLGLAR